MADTPTTPARRRARRASATVLSAALALIGLNLGLAGYVHLRPGFRDPVCEVKVQGAMVRFAASGTSSDKVLVLGSSRTAAAVDPLALEASLAARTGRPAAAFNLAQQGDGPVSQLVHYRRARDAGVTPDLVVAELLPIGFAWYGNRPYDADILRPDRLTRAEIRAVERYGFPAEPMRSDWQASARNPWFGLRFQLLSSVRPRWQPPGAVVHRRTEARQGGWTPLEPVPPAVAKAYVSLSRQGYQPDLQRLDFTRPQAAALPDLIRVCQAAGVRVAVVVPPENSDFRSWYPPAGRAALQGYIERLKRDTGAAVVDAREWMPDEAFHDGHHLVRTWVPAYTDRLVREAVVPALESPAPLVARRSP